MPVGRDESAAPAGWQEPHAGREDGQESIKNGGALCWLRRNAGWDYAALVALAAFAGGFAVAGFAAFALSFAANSCLTLVVIAATSTL